MEGWAVGDYTPYDPGQKWNIVDKYSIAAAFNNE